MAFLPGGEILVTERPGRLRIVRNGVLDPAPVKGLPAVQAAGLAGLMDIALHPRFAENKLVYLTYHKPAGGVAPAPGPGGTPGTITLARARWDGAALVEWQDLFSAIPSGNASRIAFGKDGMVYMTVGYGDTPVGNPDPAGAPPQDRMSLSGKVLRLKDDGTVPPDNPFVGPQQLPSGDLHARASQHAGPRRSSRHRRYPGIGERSERRRRNQRAPGRARITDGPSSATAASIWARA